MLVLRPALGAAQRDHRCQQHHADRVFGQGHCDQHADSNGNQHPVKLHRTLRQSRYSCDRADAFITPQATSDEIVVTIGDCGTLCDTATVSSSPSYTWNQAVFSNEIGEGSAIFYGRRWQRYTTTITIATSVRGTPYDLVGSPTSGTFDQTGSTASNISAPAQTGTTGTPVQALEIAIATIRSAGVAGSLSAIGGTVGSWTTTTGTGSAQSEGWDIGDAIGTYGLTMGISPRILVAS